MHSSVLRWLACPLCRGALEEGAGEGTIECSRGHVFPLVAGVPRLLPEQAGSAAQSIRESFSREWAHFDYEGDRTWGQTVDERRADFLRHIARPAEWLRGKAVLDAGCGNGVLTRAMASFGCEVVGTDISSSVETAHRRLAADAGGRLHFVQGDLMQPPLRSDAFDVVYCAGVLHHTPDTRATLQQVAKALAPGGTIFVWLYWREPGLKARLSELLRRAISPLPAPLKHGAVAALLPQTMLRQYVRSLRGRAQRLNAREVLVRMLDSYTPRYRWLHTPDELAGWYRELGLTEVEVTERGECGFGVAARRPPAALNGSGG